MNDSETAPHTIRPIDGEEEIETPTDKRIVYAVFSVLILLGVLTGYVLSRGGGISFPRKGGGQTSLSGGSPKIMGATDSKIFKDFAEGVIQAGGMEGEGTHKLIREGGPSQTVYLTSSVIDLDQFVGKKVKVWGQTVTAKKAAWLMDVGKIELQ